MLDSFDPHATPADYVHPFTDPDDDLNPDDNVRAALLEALATLTIPVTSGRGITYGPRIVYGTHDKPTVAGQVRDTPYTAPSCFVCQRHPDAHEPDCPVPYGHHHAR